MGTEDVAGARGGEGRDGAAAAYAATPGAGLLAAVRAGVERGAVWRHETAELDVNVVAFGAGEGVAEHVNGAVDVVIVGLSGSGTVMVEGRAYELAPGGVVVVPKGARRSTRAGADHVVYVTCHRRRTMLMPARPDG